MRMLLALLAGMLLTMTPPATTQAQTGFWSQLEVAELDRLHRDLKSAPDEASARAIADRIWLIWTRPDDQAVAMRVAEILEKAGFGGPATQMPLIEDLVADHPDYPEAWYFRATARFMRGDNEGALSDIEEVLKREPRHFGALAGRALILHGMGRGEEALEAIRLALAVHPFLAERTLFPELGP